MLLRPRNREGSRNTDQEKEADDREWVHVTTLHSSTKIPFGEAETDVSLP